MNNGQENESAKLLEKNARSGGKNSGQRQKPHFFMSLMNNSKTRFALFCGFSTENAEPDEQERVSP